MLEFKQLVSLSSEISANFYALHCNFSNIQFSLEKIYYQITTGSLNISGNIFKRQKEVS